MIIAEHLALLLAGFACGATAAAVGVMPALRSPGAEVPYALLGVIAAAVLLNGMLWTVAASALSLRGSLIDGLRNE
jgi:hypothetical protein